MQFMTAIVHLYATFLFTLVVKMIKRLDAVRWRYLYTRCILLKILPRPYYEGLEKALNIIQENKN